MTERDIFLAATDLTDPQARAAYLDEACAADLALRGRVEALLQSHAQAGSFLGTPAVPRPDPEHAGTRVYTPGPDAEPGRAGGPHGAPESDDEPLTFLAPPTRPDSLGRIGHYEVLQLLGRGAFGIVFRAFDDVLQRVVAVKVMAPQLAATSPARKRFLREARTSAQVRHENVVGIHEVGEHPLPYLVMEFIPGETLQQRLDRCGPLDVAEVVRIGRQVAEGLAAAHACDLIHRDIKPGNVLLEGGSHKAKITDFGLARAADDASISQSGIIAGTPMYMAPEQALGHDLDQRADLFSLGTVLYQMAAGRPPFRANSTVAVLKRVAEDTPRDIRAVIPETPRWLCDIIAKLHAKSPGDRYQSAREVAEVLAECEDQLKTNSKVKSFRRIPRTRSASSGKWKWAAAAVVLLPVIALAATEFAGVTNLFRGQQATADPSKPGGDLTPVAVPKQEPPPVQVAKKEPPVPVAKQEPPSLAVAPFDAVQAKKLQEGWAEHLGVDVEHANSIGMKFHLIPPGEFLMGASDQEIERALVGATLSWQVTRMKAEGPQRKMTVREPFYLGQFEVTLGQFRQFVRDTGSKTTAETNGKGGERHSDGKIEASPDYIWSNPIDSETDDHPVVFVSIEDARQFCRWLSKKEGRRYAVPRDDQWEFACRAGTTTRWFDERDVQRIAWARENSEGRLHPIGQKAANPFGVHDMHGNAAELCESVPPNKVARRGGDSGSSVVSCRSASRWEVGESLPSYRNGFRVAIVGDLRPPTSLPTPVPVAKSEPPPAVAPFTDADVQRVAALPAAEQVEEVRKELMRRNPGFDGTVGHKIEEDKVTELRIVTDKVTDIAPIRVFNSLRTLDLSGTQVNFVGNGQLADLSPLIGMNLAGLGRLHLNWTMVGDEGLVHFKDCKKLTFLALDTTQVSDTGLAYFKDNTDLTYLNLNRLKISDAGLAHFKNCKNLKFLHLGVTPVSDAGLSYFKECEHLTVLGLSRTRVTDAGLAHFKDCKKLANLALVATQVTDVGLAHFKDFKELTRLHIGFTKVTDLSLIKGMPLKELDCDFRPERDAEILRSIKTLEKINGKPAAEFWERYDKGEFNK